MSTQEKPRAVRPEVVESLAALPALPTVHQAAVALQVADLTIRRRVADETLKAFRIGPRAIRIDKESLIRFASRPLSRD